MVQARFMLDLKAHIKEATCALYTCIWHQEPFRRKLADR